MTDLLPGTYYIREIETLEGYTVTGEVILVKIDEHYIIPDEMYRLINYTEIQTGVHLAVTGVMWIGIALMIISGTIGVIRRKRKM